MESLDFTLKLLSPAFIAGANYLEDNIEGKRIKRLIAQDELLRVPSLRGVLRFWFRTYIGSMHSEISTIKEKEALMFGDNNFGQGIRIISTGKEDVSIGEVSVLQDTNIGYLGYGPLLYKKDKNETKRFTSYHSNPKSNRRDAIYPNSLFHFRAIGNFDQIEILKKILILMHLFGSVGSRSRRGWGSIAVVKPTNLFPEWEGNLKKWINKSLDKLWDGGFNFLKNVEIKNFSTFSKNTVIAISKNFQKNDNTYSYQKLLEEVATSFVELRNYKKSKIGSSDHDNEYKDFNRKTLMNIPQRLAFGMPYKVMSRNNLMGIEYLNESLNNPNNDFNTRRASPLFLKIIETPDNRLYAVALFLKASFFGDSSAKLVAKYRVQKSNKQINQKEKWQMMNGKKKMNDFYAIDSFLKDEIWQFTLKPQ